MDNNLQVQTMQDEHIMHTYGRYGIAIEKGKGCTAYDANGREYLDVSSGIGVNSLGYSDDGFIAAVTGQLQKVQHVSNYFYSRPSAELAQSLCGISHFTKVCFGNSGAEANECAIKLARKYSFDKYGGGRNKIITLKNSFHGRTVTTLSATGQDVFHNYFFPFTEGFCYAPPNDFDALAGMIDDSTCAVMIECIQGEGGVNILEEQFVRQTAALCKEKDILLITDEIQTGAGRTGKFFSFEHYGILPDIATLAKGIGGGLPIGICLCTKELEGVMTPSTHGTTFGANPVSCAGANYVFSVISRPEFLEEVTKKGEYLASKLQALPGVKQVRHKGLMLGIELEKDNAAAIARQCAANGLLIITAKNLLRMLPPLTITREEMDKAAEILKQTILEDE